MSGLRFGILSQEALIFVAHELGRKQHRGCQVDGSRQLVGEQEVGLSSDRPRQSAEACEANQKVDSNGGAQELRENRKSQAWHHYP